MRRFLQASTGGDIDGLYVDQNTNSFHAPKVRASDVAAHDLSVTGRANVANLFVSGHMRVPSPIGRECPTTKQYVDLGRATAGIGLCKVGTTFNVEVHQPMITSVGTLDGLTVQGPSIFSKVTAHEVALDTAIVHGQLSAETMETLNLVVNRNASVESMTVGKGGLSVTSSIGFEGDFTQNGSSIAVRKGKVPQGESSYLLTFSEANVIASVKCLTFAALHKAVFLATCLPVADHGGMLLHEDIKHNGEALSIVGAMEDPCGLRLTFVNTSNADGNYVIKIEVLNGGFDVST